MRGFFSSFIDQFVKAPSQTQWAAFLAASAGLVGLTLAVARARHLRQSCHHLASITPEWDAFAAVTKPSGFRQLMARLERARAASGSEPEQVWRAAVDALLAGEEQWESFVRSLISVAVLLGLAGTVLGFMNIAPTIMQRAIDQLVVSSQESSLEPWRGPRRSPYLPGGLASLTVGNFRLGAVR